MKEKKFELTLDYAWNFCQKIIIGDFSKCNLVITLPQKNDFLCKSTALRYKGFIEYIHRKYSWNIVILDQIDKYNCENNVTRKIKTLFHEIGHMVAFLTPIHGHYSKLKQETGAMIIQLTLINFFELATGLKFKDDYDDYDPLIIANNIIREKNINQDIKNYLVIIEEVKQMTDEELLKYNYGKNSGAAP